MEAINFEMPPWGSAAVDFKKNFLVTDVDDVLSDWYGAFSQYMGHHLPKHREEWEWPTNWKLKEFLEMDDATYTRHVVDFNSSAKHMAAVTPIHGAQKVIKKLHEEVNIMAVSACGDDPAIVENRKRYLAEHFGIDTVICLPLGTSKKEVLTNLAGHFHWGPRFWIEDNYQNAIDGADATFTTMFFSPHNQPPPEPADYRIKWCQSWDSIYTEIQRGIDQDTFF